MNTQFGLYGMDLGVETAGLLTTRITPCGPSSPLLSLQNKNQIDLRVASRQRLARKRDRGACVRPRVPLPSLFIRKIKRI
jgi:hypothetical protein